jgi:indole-3-glycerol phosphate synthase
MAAILDQIIEATKRRVAAAKEGADLHQLEARADRHQPRGFSKALERARDRAAVIAEIKQASPSRGIIRGTMHVGHIANDYALAGAAALSVLTEEDFFRGSLANLVEASAATKLPCLRKDFIIDEFQLLEARANCADAVLLIAAILNAGQLAIFSAMARGLGLDVLCEVHDEWELERAVAAGCEIIGVNSRDLRTFEVNLQTAVRLAPMIPGSALKVAESGIRTGADITRLRAAGYDAFLIGESLMKEDSPGRALRALLAEVEQPPQPSSR